jgi:hypothetical protein
MLQCRNIKYHTEYHAGTPFPPFCGAPSRFYAPVVRVNGYEKSNR